MRVNWTEFDKPGFKSGVVHPFLKYIKWMGAGFFSLVQFTKFDRFLEGSGGEQSESSAPTPEATPAPSVPPPPTARPKVVPSKTAPASQPATYKKRPFAYTEDNSEEDDDDVDMDNIEDNDSSGSSVNSDHVPAKRLRMSIATRSSQTTPAPERSTTEANVRQGSSPAVDNNPLSPNNQVDMESGPGSESNSGPEISAGSGANPPPIGIDINPADDTARRAAPTPRRLSSVAMDTDIRSAGLGPNDATRVDADHVLEPADPLPIVPPNPSSPSLDPVSDSELEIPDFLRGKHDIYSYLSAVKEPGYQRLLKSYITFELSNHSSTFGMLTAARRPKGVGWWSSRARPNRFPPYDSLNSFATSIVEWWSFIQPMWRRIEPGKVSRDDGDWERLYHPGINGLLNVIILAYWWAKILEEREAPVDNSYSWFVSDVTWVLSRLTAAAHEGTY